MNQIPRREFLRHTTAAALAALSIPISARAATQPGISLGFSLYGMKALPLDEALRACAEIGYRNIELALTAGYASEPKLLSPRQRATLRSQLESLKLEVSALMLNMSLAAGDPAHAQHLEALEAAAQLAHELAPSRPPLLETVLGGKPAEWESIKDRMAERLRSWADAAAAAKITLALKAHVGSAVNTPERLLWLLQKANSPALKAAYDFSHFEVQGLALAESLQALFPQIGFIHVKDSRGDAGKFEFLLPGEGRTDYTAYFYRLQQLGYRGPVVVEVSAQVFNKPGYEPIGAAKKCYAALATAMEKAGVPRG